MTRGESLGMAVLAVVLVLRLAKDVETARPLAALPAPALPDEPARGGEG